MRHGSHGDACFRPFADYRKREGTKQPRGGWPTSPTRLSRRPGVSGSSALPWTTPGCGRLRREPGRRRRRCTRPRPGWPSARRPLTTPRPRRRAGEGRRRTRPHGRRAGVVADQEDRTTAPRPRLRLGLPRDLCRAASCSPRGTISCGLRRTLQRALDPRAQAATATPTATPRRRVLQALKRCVSRRSRR
jgi:hypothetical protein